MQGDHIADWEPLQKQGREIRAEIEESLRERIRIKAYFDTVEVPKLRTVLQLTYIEVWMWMKLLSGWIIAPGRSSSCRIWSWSL